MGLVWHLEAGAVLPSGANVLSFVLAHDWRGVDVQTAETMAFVTLSLAELFRAYTVRSERASIFQIGFFSNKYMQYAVGLSIALLLIVCAVPFLQPIFNTHFLSGREWGLVLGLALMPAVAEVVEKAGRRRNGRRRGIEAQGRGVPDDTGRGDIGNFQQLAVCRRCGATGNHHIPHLEATV